MKELDYYRGQHRAAMSQLEAAATESSTLRAKYSEIAAEKLRLERDMQTLQMEIGELRSQVLHFVNLSSSFNFTYFHIFYDVL